MRKWHNTRATHVDITHQYKYMKHKHVQVGWPPPHMGWEALPNITERRNELPALSNERIRRGISLNDDVSLDQTVTSLNH